MLGRESEPSKNSSKSVKVGINHLLPCWRWILGELHHNKPVIVVASREHNRLPLLVATAPFRRVIGINRRRLDNRHPSPRPGGGDTPEQRIPCAEKADTGNRRESCQVAYGKQGFGEKRGRRRSCCEGSHCKLQKARDLFHFTLSRLDLEGIRYWRPKRHRYNNSWAHRFGPNLNSAQKSETSSFFFFFFFFISK